MAKRIFPTIRIVSVAHGRQEADADIQIHFDTMVAMPESVIWSVTKRDGVPDLKCDMVCHQA
ncbi:MAG: hypothetical protein H7833_15615 [Magnetococcus sp. DMHC-1]|nr:hypothetical protein [Magnetococcales bacterium]